MLDEVLDTTISPSLKPVKKWKNWVIANNGGSHWGCQEHDSSEKASEVFATWFKEMRSRLEDSPHLRVEDEKGRFLCLAKDVIGAIQLSIC